MSRRRPHDHLRAVRQHARPAYELQDEPGHESCGHEGVISRRLDRGSYGSLSWESAAAGLANYTAITPSDGATFHGATKGGWLVWLFPAEWTARSGGRSSSRWEGRTV